MYPRVITDTRKLLFNARSVLELCRKHNVTSSMLVVKCLAGNLHIVRKLASLDFAYLADSRIENLQRFRSIPKKKALLRLPQPSEISKVVKYADLSLNSELKTIELLDDAAKKLGIKHEIMLMFDIGDLREGIYFESDYLPLISRILQLENIVLKGIGTNLTCYGGVIPTPKILEKLVWIKKRIEQAFPVVIELVSGGNSSSFHLLEKGLLPPEINSLRYGEIFLMGRETAYGRHFDDLYSDVFTFQAQIIEAKEKPSYPIGDIGMNSFGEKPVIHDQGLMNRGLLAIGKQDVILDNIIPKDKSVHIIGGSSDHLIVDLGTSEKRVGDIIDFNLNYPALLHLMNSRYVKKAYR